MAMYASRSDAVFPCFEVIARPKVSLVVALCYVLRRMSAHPEASGWWLPRRTF